MSQLFNGSICLSDLIANAKLPHSAFTKANNGKIYANISIWLNDEPDKFGNVICLQLNSTKEMRETEGKVYIGNAKKSENAAPEPLSQDSASELPEDDDLTF